MQTSTRRVVWKILIQFALHFVFVHMTFSLSTRVINQSCRGEVDGSDRLGLLQAECREKERYFALDNQNKVYSKRIVL